MAAPSPRRESCFAPWRCLLVAALAACVAPVHTELSTPEALCGARRVIVMPFSAQGEDVSDEAVELVAARVVTRLSAPDRFVVISPVDVRTWLERAPESDRGDLVGAFGADAFLLGRVERFEGHVSAKGRAQGPSSVAFTLVLEGVDGAPIWSGRYAERQRGWIEDLGSLGRAYARGFRWVDPVRLASYGAAALIDDLTRRVPCERGGAAAGPATSLGVRRLLEDPC